jgi:mRNA interferase MazF
MMSGDILLAHLPQADGIRKYRPVLLLGVTPPYGDFLVCGLTSSFDASEERRQRVLRSLGSYISSLAS